MIEIKNDNGSGMDVNENVEHETSEGHDPQPDSSNAGLTAGELVSVPLEDINLEDRTYEFRVEYDVEDLVESISRDGQQIPVILRGERPPYQVISGFRRITAIRKLGRSHVIAIIRGGLTDRQANLISFIENEKRLAMDPIDRANFIYRLAKGGTSRKEIMEILTISERTLQRAQLVQKMEIFLQDQLAQRQINLKHALLLHRYGEFLDLDFKDEVERIILDEISAAELEEDLKERAKEKKNEEPQPTLKIKDDGKSFTLGRIIFDSKKTSSDKKAEIVEALEKALDALKEEDPS